MYPLVHAGEVPVGVLVGAIVIAVASVSLLAMAVVLLAVIARRLKARKCGAFELEATVSVDK